MPKNIIVDWKTEEQVVEFAKQKNASVEASKGKVSFVVKKGNQKIAVFWNPSEEGQKIRKDVIALAELFDISLALHPDITPGILGVLFLKKVIGIDPKHDTRSERNPSYYGRNILAKAEKSSDEYWSYQFFQEHEAQWLIDRDIKSAFFTSLCQLPSLYLFEHKNGGTTFEPDGGAVKKLKQWSPHLPKWFKHRLVGMLASKKYCSNWGAAFNAASFAIQNLHNVMADARKIVDGYCVRCHTDCFTLTASTPQPILKDLESFLASKGFELSTKRLGYGQLWDTGFGFIGFLNPIGSERDVHYEMRVRGLAYKPAAFSNELVENFGDRTTTHILQAGNRQIYGHWNGRAFFSIVQPLNQELSQSKFYQAYEMTPEKAEKFVQDL